jgi:hypothetical protein
MLYAKNKGVMSHHERFFGVAHLLPDQIIYVYAKLKLYQ